MNGKMKKKIFAEFLGTFTLIFLGAGSLVVGEADLVGVALAHALAIFVMVSALAGISSAHFNPAVSIAMFATKRIDLKELLINVPSQLAGAAFASLALNGLYGHQNGYGLTSLGSGISATQGFFAELFGTAILLFVIFGVAVDGRSSVKSLPGLPIGLSIAAIIMSVGPATGAALNPARWFGPALVSGDWSNSALYIFGPIVGALVAALAYTYIAKPKN